LSPISSVRSVSSSQLSATPGWARMTCGCFWKIAATLTTGISSAAALKACKQVAAHVELDAVGQQQGAVVDLRAAGDDRDVEAAFGVGAIGDRLVEAAMFGLGQPVGAEGDLSQVLGGGGCQLRARRQARKRTCEAFPKFSPKVVVMTMTLGALAEVVRAAAWPMIALRFRAGFSPTFKGSVPIIVRPVPVDRGWTGARRERSGESHHLGVGKMGTKTA
jgi:hypothetical protein